MWLFYLQGESKMRRLSTLHLLLNLWMRSTCKEHRSWCHNLSHCILMFQDTGVCVCVSVCLPGGGISRSVVCWTLVLPGRGSKAGTRAENCLLRTKSSSQVLLRPPLVSYSSSSWGRTTTHSFQFLFNETQCNNALWVGLTWQPWSTRYWSSFI